MIGNYQSRILWIFENAIHLSLLLHKLFGDLYQAFILDRDELEQDNQAAERNQVEDVSVEVDQVFSRPKPDSNQ